MHNAVGRGMRGVATFAAAALALAWLATGCDRAPAPPPPTPSAATGSAGASPATSEPVAAATPASTATRPATPATGLTQIDLQGLRELIAQTAQRDQILVIDFWATWCAPCTEMFPDLHRRLKALGGRVRPVSVTLDSPGAMELKARAFLEKHHAAADAFMLPPDADARLAVIAGLATQWKDLVVPAVLVFDAKGKLAGEFIENVEVDPVVRRVEALLAPQGESKP